MVEAWQVKSSKNSLGNPAAHKKTPRQGRRGETMAPGGNVVKKRDPKQLRKEHW